MQDWVYNHLNDLKPEDFYKEFSYLHISRKDAEEQLQLLLSNIKKERNPENSRKAKCLLNIFKFLYSPEQSQSTVRNTG
ncbi:hypothetical protein BC938DRAFT_471273 [Jimgerdemannia flammicorona]|uniref:Uncharacterized protein n=1 Tax=Jimgerdemannia flammicorona TaxID=994334 RepID=A0A433Q8J2_9FUNG|nr:hypothetical protein BC938DRAFT_471273 [Jimgerdemannia flammicorona]